MVLIDFSVGRAYLHICRSHRYCPWCLIYFLAWLGLTLSHIAFAFLHFIFSLPRPLVVIPGCVSCILISDSCVLAVLIIIYVELWAE